MTKELPAKRFSLEELDKRLGDTFWSPIDVTHINDWVLRVSQASN